MSDNAFDLVEQALQSGGSQAGFDFLARRFREEKNYPMLFEARLMKKRHELGLPLLQSGPLEDLPHDKEHEYEAAFIEAAHEVGDLFLADGDIQRAWPYFRAIGETAPVAEAIERVQPQEGMDPIIEIAFYERVHPRKGFELILANYGTCRAISSFEQYPVRKGREECIRLLVRTLHAELAESLKRAIAEHEGQAPDAQSIRALIAGRDWLFEGNSYHLDSSHLAAVLRFSLDLNDRETLALALELAEYGTRLSPLFQYRGDPPFQNVYEDHAIYLRALLGEGADAAVAHFRRKVADADPNQASTAPAQMLVLLLARLKRYSEAIEVSLEHLSQVEPNQLVCPSVLQLCQMAGDHERLRMLARERGDLLGFAAAALYTNSRPRA